MMTRRRIQIPWLALAASVLCACGGDKPAAPAATEATEPEPEAATAELQAAKPAARPAAEEADACPESKRDLGSCRRLYGDNQDPDGQLGYLPDDFPAPPANAEYCGVGKAPITKHWAYYASELPMQEVIDHYTRALEAAGYEAREQELNRTCDRKLVASKGGKDVASINVDGGLKSFTISKPF